MVQKQKPFTVPVSKPAGKGESSIYRARESKDGLLVTPNPKMHTLHDLLQESTQKFGDKTCMGQRTVIKEYNEEKMVKKVVNGEEIEVPKKWTYWELSEYKYRSFNDVKKESATVGAGLRKLGVNPHDRIEIYAATSSHWQLIAHGCLSQSIEIVTAYDTLGEEGLTHSLLETGAVGLFLDGRLVNLITRVLSKTPQVKYIICKDDVSQNDLDALRKGHDHLTVLTYNELLELGKNNPLAYTPPKPDDIACIMYTSGSMGPPKGVILTHGNILAAVAGVNNALGHFLNEKDYALCFLPLAHIFEFVYELSCILWGSTIGYGTVKTLTEASVRNCKGDIKEFRPTMLVSVPAVFESIRKGIIGRVQGTGLKEKIFWAAFTGKSFLQRYHLPGQSVFDALVFNKVKEATGGRVRLCLSGGSPLAVETQHFITVSIAPLVVGYGLTETCAMAAIMNLENFEWGSVGVSVACAEMKLVDVPEAGYFANNNPPQGELWIRGPSIPKGYLKREAETKEAFTEDGWFLTGDVAQWQPSGVIKLIDRRKNLVKTLNGEYIAIEKLESLYRTCHLVQNICVYADPQQYKPIAIVLPAEPALKSFVISKGLGTESSELEDIVKDRKVQDLVYQEVLSAGKKGRLAGIELLEGIVLAHEEWTPENGMLTAAQKLSRRKILDTYRKEMDEIYNNSK